MNNFKTNLYFIIKIIGKTLNYSNRHYKKAASANNSYFCVTLSSVTILKIKNRPI